MNTGTAIEPAIEVEVPSPSAAARAPRGAAVTYAAVDASLSSSFRDALKRGKLEDAMLQKLAPSIDRLIQASRESECEFEFVHTAGPYQRRDHSIRQARLASMLRAEASRRLIAGDRDGAAEASAAELRMAAQLGASARIAGELVEAMGIATAACDWMVTQANSIGGGAKQAELGAALEKARSSTYDRVEDVLRSDAAVTAAWLRSVSDADYGAVRPPLAARSRAEREAAATRFEANRAEALRVWNAADAIAMLQALRERAKSEGLGDLTKGDVSPERIRHLMPGYKAKLDDAGRALAR